MTKNLSSLITNTLTAGSSGKNYLATAANTATGWATSNIAQLTVATSTTGSELPRASTTLTGIKITPISSTAYAYARFTLDAADAAGMPQLVTWAQKPVAGYASGDLKVDVYTNTASDYSGTYTRVALTTDVSAVSAIPNMTGQYATKFIPATTPLYYEVRITRVAGTTALVISDASVGPQALVQGAAITDWVSYTPTVTGMTDNTGTIQGWWRRVGSNMEFKIDFLKSGTAGSGTNAAIFSIPSGYTYLSGAGLFADSGSPICGFANTYSVETLNQYDRANVMADSGAGTGVRLVDPGAANVYKGSDFRAGCQVNLCASVPIDQWAGSGTQTNLVQADCEYASNSGTATGADDSTNFAYGPSGSQFVSFTVEHYRDVQFRSPIQPTDTILLEASFNGGTTWTTIGQVSGAVVPYHQQNTLTYGMGWQVNGASQVRVYFGAYRAATGATFGAAGLAWSGIAASSTYLWRVKKLSGGTVAGVAEGQPGVAAGLVGYYGTKGRVDGSALTTGYVGERVTATLATNTGASSPAIGAWADVTGLSITVGAGVWRLTAMTSIQSQPGGTGYIITLAGIRDSSNNLIANVTACVAGVAGNAAGAPQTGFGGSTVSATVNVSASTTYKFSLYSLSGTASPTVGTLAVRGDFTTSPCIIEAVRIA